MNKHDLDSKNASEDHSPKENDRLIREWEALMRRIESIDARIWQGAGILLVMSVGGISLLVSNSPTTITGLLLAIIVGVVSILVLIVWYLVLHRWIFIQGVCSFRAREIEDILGSPRFNLYASMIEYWDKSVMDVEENKRKLHENQNETYTKLEKFRTDQKEKFPHLRTIRSSLERLTRIIIVAWGLFIVFQIIAYCTK